MVLPVDDSARLGGFLGTRGRAWRVGDGLVDFHPPAPEPRPITVDARAQPIRFDLRRSALVVIDMQHDFCHADGWLASIGVDVTAARAPIAPLEAGVPALRDAGIAIVWVNWGTRPDRVNLPPNVRHVYDRDGRDVGIGSSVPTGHPVLQRGSWGAALVEELEAVRNPDDVSIDKHRMSGFWDTELDSALRGLDVDTLLFAGVNADQCVLATLIDAACIGYDAVFLEDVCATTSPEYCWDATVYNVRQCFGFTSRLDTVLAAIAADGPER
ncbi:MAG: cysteine hydrolase family protein [Acidimicrobiales bacterium]